MQIRYLEAMQAMAKTANSKVSNFQCTKFRRDIC
jgi:hypothetical protein